MMMLMMKMCFSVPLLFPHPDLLNKGEHQSIKHQQDNNPRVNMMDGRPPQLRGAAPPPGLEQREEQPLLPSIEERGVLVCIAGGTEFSLESIHPVQL